MESANWRGGGVGVTVRFTEPPTYFHRLAVSRRQSQEKALLPCLISRADGGF